MYEHQLLDMFEVGVENFKSCKEFPGQKPEIGNRPLLLFDGENWETTEETKTMKSLLLDLYTGDKSSEKLDLRGLSHCMTLTLVGKVGSPYRIQVRVYQIVLKKSGVNVPRVELVEMGPSMDFVQRRCTLAQPEVWKDATKMPKVNKEKKQKNVETNERGETLGRVWLEKQDLSTLQTRKMKGLKRKAMDEMEEAESD
jgi:ribosome production factor 2